MKIEKVLTICLLIISCSSSGYIDNKKMISSIDSMEITKTIAEVETDSIGKILDTISITYFKYDLENRKRYREKIYRYKNRELTSKDYFKPDEDLFYRVLIHEKGKSESIFETRSNKKGRVVKAIEVIKEQGRIDTIFMDYSRDYYFNGNVKELFIKTFHEEVGEIHSKVFYDKNGKPLYEVMVSDNDTMNLQSWEYMDSILKKSIHTNYQIDTSKSIYYFEVNKKLIKEEKFEFHDGKFNKSKEIEYFYNKSNERSKSIERNHETEEVKYIEYIKKN